MVVSYLFASYHDAHLCDVVGGSRYSLWQASLLSPFFRQNVVQVWNSTRNDGRNLPCDKEDISKMVKYTKRTIRQRRHSENGKVHNINCPGWESHIYSLTS